MIRHAACVITIRRTPGPYIRVLTLWHYYYVPRTALRTITLETS